MIRRYAPRLIAPKRVARRYTACLFLLIAAVFSFWSVFWLSNLNDASVLSASGDSGGEQDRRLNENPEDAMSLKDRRRGGVILHLLGLLYMFIAIATVCDEFFVPALEVIAEVLELSPDVAGATFMAAGGSAPEFFTSMIGAVLMQSDVGISTIVGSAVFNVLFCIGACALVAPKILTLTWFPLARDSIFYTVDLIVVTVCFWNGSVDWGEAGLLFILYIAYVTFMRFSPRVEAHLCPEAVKEATADKECWAKSRDQAESTTSSDGQTTATSGMGTDIAGTGETSENEKEASHKSPRSLLNRQPTAGEFATSKSPKSSSSPNSGLRHKNSNDSNVVLPLRPLNEDDGDETEENDGRCIAEEEEDSTGGSGGTQGQFACGLSKDESSHTSGWESAAQGIVPTPNVQETTLPGEAPQIAHTTPEKVVTPSHSGKGVDGCSSTFVNVSSTDKEENKEEDAAEKSEEEAEPMSLYPPDWSASKKDWLWYIVTLPIATCLVLTIPDVRREGYKKFFAISFFSSIMWIACFTYIMVWFSVSIAETCGVASHVMALVVLAPGTSVPDLITSVIVARDGKGDMAVSSSIGSNIFDVTVGLPIPWLLYACLNNGKAVTINNKGMEILVMMLLLMLVSTIFTIMCSGWAMNRVMGLSMMILYVVFTIAGTMLSMVPEENLRLFGQ